jgi:hypothetical protein
MVSLVAASLVSSEVHVWAADGQMFKNRVGMSYRPTFLISASFRNIGAAGPASNPGLAAPDQDHTYDDGYVKRDSATGDGYTWNWGYQSNGQTPGNDTIAFHSAQSRGDGRLDGISSEPQHGLEITYERWMGRLADNGNWGWAFAFDYANVGIRTDRSARATGFRTTDTYALNGVITPEAPYNGSFDGPGPLISDLPSRSGTTLPSGALVNGRHEIDADVFGLHVGPYFEFPLNDRWNVNFSSGLALAVVNSKFSFSESASVGGVPVGSVSGAGSKADVLFGGYVAVNFSYALSPQWNLVTGVEYQGLTDFKQTANGREAKLDFLTGVSVKAGLSFSF